MNVRPQLSKVFEKLDFEKFILQGAPEQVIHCIRPKIELLLLLSQNSFVGL
jgi:hypothetical protein